ncbi:hypothetical protein CONLIGDRAFT_685958 [Coniochaeta ligniaria NRRL 30616]|uniref:Uncharacterized protein n=1 Tax=Coniochaeta ligniaria NRRL 30616 TaxID=1408157 RepID=A0A1J7IA60_9PEZI|nr:hypothetical protein CONLIGDRAFT_685958 [Coniochaeta ligniaria NRRL 30616]
MPGVNRVLRAFVLAQQPSGYFVLIDTMSYINECFDEEEDAIHEGQESPETAEPETAVVPDDYLKPESSPKTKC